MIETEPSKPVPKTLSSPETPDIAFSQDYVQPGAKVKKMAEVIARHPLAGPAELARIAGTTRELVYKTQRTKTGQELIKHASRKQKSQMNKSLGLREILLADLSEQVASGNMDTRESLAALKVVDDLVRTDRELGLSVGEDEQKTQNIRDTEVEVRLRSFLAGLLISKLDPKAAEEALKRTFAYFQEHGLKPPMASNHLTLTTLTTLTTDLPAEVSGLGTEE
jgi:hypothetical protein